MRLIESYDPDSTVVLEGRTFPATCLLEDEDGFRWYLIHDDGIIDINTWVKATAGGAAAILMPRWPDGARTTDPVSSYLVVTTEDFMDNRFERGTALAYNGYWKTFSAIPSYTDLLASYAAPQAAPSPEFEAAEAEVEVPVSGFVHLHNHSEFSPLDGLSSVKEIADAVVAQGGQAVGVADHGNCAAHPDLQKACDKAGIKPIFAMEAYFVDNRKVRPDDLVPADLEKDQAAQVKADAVAVLRDYYHLVLIATDDVGLKNLWAMSTESYRDGFYYKPRLDWETLRNHSEGIIATSACLRGPLTHHALLDGNEQAAIERLGRLLEIFGDRFYVEIHTNHLEEQVRVNHDLVRIARQHGVPLVAAVDAHYAKPEDREAHRVWLSAQTNADIADETTLFAGGQDYHIKTEAEVRQALAYLGEDVVEESVRNTAVIASMCTAQVKGEVTTPIYSKKGGHEADAARLMELCLEWWHKTTGKRESEDVYIARFEREFKLLVQKKFCGYFLMWADICRWAKSNGILVGPGRGSGGGSLVAYLAGITDIDPVDADLLFERFLTEGRTSLPDFDVDFPQSRKKDMQAYVRERFGEENVTVVGSILRLKNKGVVKQLASAMSSTLPDDYYTSQQAISAIIDDAEGDTAGLGLSWDDLWAKAGDLLQAYRDDQPHLFAMADRLVGRVKTFGQHAAGLVISTDADSALVSWLPMRRAEEEGHLIAQFDKDVLEEIGLVKFDLLTLRNLDTIQDCIDLIRARRGHEVDVYSWSDEYQDPQVWEEISAGHTLGIFQIETTLGKRYAEKMRPKNLADLADLVTVVRPGPRNSGLTETYIARRDGEQAISFPDPRLEQVLAKTYGCLLYQEDIMQTCMVLGGYDSNEADGVRKILGKKKVELVAAAGQEFISRSVERGMERHDAEALWSQMAEFAKYSFNRAHAYAYAVLAYWCAWLKFHYPVEFLTAAMSSVDKDRIPDFIKEARRMGFAIQAPDINESGVGFKAGSLSVRYGLDSIKGIAGAALHIQAAQPFTSFDDFMTRVVEPKGSKVNKGHVALLARIGAFDSLVPNRRGLEQMLLADKTGVSTRCVFKTNQADTFTWVSINPKTKEETVVRLPCSFDWDSEPDPINERTGKKMKRKAPVKRCTTACRNYEAPPPTQIEDVEPYTELDIRDIEQEMLGVHLSSTPFDILPAEDREMTRQQAELALSAKAPEGLYLIAGTLTKKRPHRDRSGREMGFLAFDTEAGSLDVVTFNSHWVKYGPSLKHGTFYIAEVEKNSRGFNLQAVSSLNHQEN